ncbi:MAG: TetR family transcriptional regulator C-terminal domain-containing protein [Thermoleophilia bacterium]|nr:TetR family transcriptional regulator C-terminal domain-containing protein [Thermoleophilia bacterium]
MAARRPLRTGDTTPSRRDLPAGGGAPAGGDASGDHPDAGPAATRVRSGPRAGAGREVLSFSDLLPRVLHDRVLRERLARLYAAYRSLDAWCLSGQGGAPDPERLEDVAALNVAVVEGLVLQQRVDPDGFDPEGPAEVWARMIELYLEWAGRNATAD